jgi:hypothetical protein
MAKSRSAKLCNHLIASLQFLWNLNVLHSDPHCIVHLQTIFFSLEFNFPLTILLTFASEGDNRGDALRLVEYYNQWADLVKLQNFAYT